MGIQTCPATLVAAPLDTVWGLLADARHYPAWTDLQLPAAIPDGPVVSGQVIDGWTRGLGQHWAVTLRVDDVDVPQHRLRFTTTLPLGASLNVGQVHDRCGWDEAVVVAAAECRHDRLHSSGQDD